MCVCVLCVCVKETEKEREGERERTSGLSQSVRVFFSTYFVSCNGPCAPKEKWHRKEHIITIIIIHCSVLCAQIVNLCWKQVDTDTENARRIHLI